MSRLHAAERISRELLEADFEIAFNLIDLSQAECVQGDLPSASRALQDAGEVSLDINRRLERIAPLDRQPFDPLLGELKRALFLAQRALLTRDR